jgi:class 3 adenylate cyclase/tetratricopeptide (TPR) repeat protein
MKCYSCGSSNPADARFCGRCGTKIVVICAACSIENAGNSSFCRRCGAALDSDASASVVRMTRDTLEPVLRSRSMLQGERKEITVLFADITGSTEIVAGVDPEQAMARLDGAIRAMTAAVRRYGGFDRPQGDGIMALFGAPLADQDHAARGCLAALAMRSAVAEFDNRLLIRVGIHSGPVVVRSIRTGAATDFDAIGETVHVAARMEQAASPGTIRVTGSVYSLAKEFVRVRPLGGLPVKGIGASVEQYELTDRTSLRTLWDARASSRLTPLVNRAPEFALLRQAAASTLAGSGRMVLVSGAAGSGKSRLVHEFLREFKTDAWIVLRSGAMPFSLNAPYAMPALLLSSWLGLDEHDAVPAVRLRQAFEAGSSRWAYPALCTILGLPPDDGEWQALDSDTRRRHTFGALADWITSLCRDRALLLVFEDLQWADSESAAVVSMLAQRAETLRLLIIATQRTGEADGFVGDVNAMAVRVDPLSPEAGQQMLAHLLGADPELAPLRQYLVEKTGGVPFFLEETTRALAETGALDDTLSGYRQRVSVDDIRVPSNVRLVLAARIDRLPPPEKELLHIASVIGPEVPRDILQSVSDLPEAEVEIRLSGLERAGFLRAAPAVLFFEHMLTRDVAYETLLLSRRKALHRSVFEAMEGRGGEPAHLLAHHAFQGELWPKALQYLLKAANRALELSAYSGAIGLLEQALETLNHLPRSPELIARGIDVRLAMRAALAAPTGDFARIKKLVGEAKAMAVEIADDRRLGVIAISEAVVSNQLGDGEGAIAAGRLAQSMAEKLNDRALAVAARIFIGQAHLWRGELAQARAALATGIQWRSSEFRHVRLGTTGTSSILSLHVLASANAFAGAFEVAEELARDAVAIAAEGGRAYDVVHAAWCRGWVLSYRGTMTESQTVLEEALRLCETMQVRYFLPVIAAVLGTVHAECGRGTQGAALLSRALATNRAYALPYGEAWSSALLAFARLCEGDTEAAASLAAQALELAARHGYGTVEVTAERVLAAAVGRLARPVEAHQHFERAIARAEALGLRPELAHCRLERGLLLRDLDRPEDARAELDLAARLYTEMDMGFWRAKAVSALDEAGSPVRQ